MMVNRSGFSVQMTEDREQMSEFSPAAGQKSGQFNRKRNFVVSYEVSGAGRMHVI